MSAMFILVRKTESHPAGELHGVTDRHIEAATWRHIHTGNDWWVFDPEQNGIQWNGLIGEDKHYQQAEIHERVKKVMETL